MSRARTKSRPRVTNSRDERPISPHVLILRQELQSGEMLLVARANCANLPVEFRQGADALWMLVRRAKRGGLAIRIAQTPGGATASKAPTLDQETLAINVKGPTGSQRVSIRLSNEEVPVIRVTTSLTPSAQLLMPCLPRDLYPLDEHDNPLETDGEVEAAQRGLNTGICYFRMRKPDFGSVLYVQNFTSLSDFFRHTRTTPDGAVGGEWPEIGYLPPSPPQSPVPPLNPLPAGEAVTVYDALLAIQDSADGDETEMAQRYLALLAVIYRAVEKPDPQFHDWIGRAERSLHDLDKAPEATIRHYGFRYLHPYTAAEYPDSMVQLSVLASLRDYEAWKGEDIPLQAELMQGLRKFYDARLNTLRRYLPNVGKDKDKDAVDSWYLYHPLMNLARLALDGDRHAKRLFLQSIDFTIKAAHHFDYHWPIQFKVTDFSVIQEARDETGRGQTDVGGLYAYVMLQAFELTDDKRFLEEARAAIKAAQGMRFELNYQANLTAWGAAACMRLWRIDNDPSFLAQSYVYVASFFHNVAMWESDIGLARHYTNFMGVTALHDAPYMALYECFDSFAAFERYLKDGGPDLHGGVRMLVSEYCRYALDRAWYYYPDALPADAIAEKQRENNGHVDRKLSFPVEDLYVDGQPAGQVGQEIYGSGAAFVFASRAFHHFEDVPFTLFCDHFLLAADRPTKHSLSFQLGGGEGCRATLRLLRKGRTALPILTVNALTGERIRAHRENDNEIVCHIPADGRISLTW